MSFAVIESGQESGVVNGRGAGLGIEDSAARSVRDRSDRRFDYEQHTWYLRELSSKIKLDDDRGLAVARPERGPASPTAAHSSEGFLAGVEKLPLESLVPALAVFAELLDRAEIPYMLDRFFRGLIGSRAVPATLARIDPEVSP